METRRFFVCKKGNKEMKKVAKCLLSIGAILGVAGQFNTSFGYHYNKGPAWVTCTVLANDYKKPGNKEKENKQQEKVDNKKGNNEDVKNNEALNQKIKELIKEVIKELIDESILENRK